VRNSAKEAAACTSAKGTFFWSISGRKSSGAASAHTRHQSKAALSRTEWAKIRVAASNADSNVVAE
jgi:hypothetical protein